MADAKFEVYGPDGSVWFSSDDRVLRVLTVSDLNPSQQRFEDPEISSNSTVTQNHFGSAPTITSGAVDYAGIPPANRPPVIMF